MRIEILFLIIAMALVTYLPRLIPLYMYNGKVSPLFTRFLRFIPYSILGVMALPGFYKSVKGEILHSFICMTGAVLIVYITENVIAAVFFSVLIAIGLSYL